jgi:hypothetical protein
MEYKDSIWAGPLDGLAWFILALGIIATVILVSYALAAKSNAAMIFGIGMGVLFSSIANFVVLRASGEALRLLREIANSTAPDWPES